MLKATTAEEKLFSMPAAVDKGPGDKMLATRMSEIINSTSNFLEILKRFMRKLKIFSSLVSFRSGFALLRQSL